METLVIVALAYVAYREWQKTHAAAPVVNGPVAPYGTLAKMDVQATNEIAATGEGSGAIGAQQVTPVGATSIGGNVAAAPPAGGVTYQQSEPVAVPVSEGSGTYSAPPVSVHDNPLPPALSPIGTGTAPSSWSATLPDAPSAPHMPMPIPAPIRDPAPIAAVPVPLAPPVSVAAPTASPSWQPAPIAPVMAGNPYEATPEHPWVDPSNGVAYYGPPPETVDNSSPGG